MHRWFLLRPGILLDVVVVLGGGESKFQQEQNKERMMLLDFRISTRS